MSNAIKQFASSRNLALVALFGLILGLAPAVYERAQGTNAPGLSVEKTGPAIVIQNQEVTYTVTVKNTLSVSAPGVSMSDIYPQSQLTFVKVSDPNCQLAGNGANIVACVAADLAAGASRTAEFTFKVKSDVPCGTAITNKAEMGAATYVANPWSMTTAKTPACPIPQLACTPNTQTVAINQYANFNATGGTGTYVWTAIGGSGEPNTNAAFSTKYTTAGTKSVSVKSGNEEATCSVTVTQPTPPPPAPTPPPPAPGVCKLEISKAVDKTNANPGNELTYVIKFKNIGTADCTGSGVRITDHLNENISFVKETHSNNVLAGYLDKDVFDEISQTLYWNAEVMTPGESGQVSWVGKVRNIGQCMEKNIPNTAYITALELNNFKGFVSSNTVNTKVKTECPPPPPPAGQCKLEVSKAVDKANADIYNELTYTITVKNSGNANCTETKIQDQLDSLLSFVRESHPNGTPNSSVDQNNKTITWNVGTLTPNQNANVAFVGKVGNLGACADRNIPNTAKVTSKEYNHSQNFVSSNTVQTNVKTDCPKPQMVCTPNTQTVNVGHNANLSATGGTGSYTWEANGGEPSTGSGANFATKYASAGTKNVKVKSGDKEATCTVTITQPGSPSLTIEKLVRNVTTNTSFAESSTAKPGETVEYRITVKNVGSVEAKDITLTDVIGAGNILKSFANFQASRNHSGSIENNGTMTLGSLNAGDTITATYRYTVATGVTNGTSVCNTATARSTNTGSVTDSACVNISVVQSANVILNYSKKAWNDTKNKDATIVTASREDFITYTLTVTNTGTTEATNFVITDDLSGVLPLADMVDAGGGTVTGQTITYPGVTVPAGQSVSKNFRVRVKYSLASNISYVMKNTYGNTIHITIHVPKDFVAPKTGGNTGSLAAIGFAGLLTGAFALHRKKNVFKLIFS